MLSTFATTTLAGSSQNERAGERVDEIPVVRTKRYMTRMIMSPLRPDAILLALKISKCRGTEDLRGLLDTFEKGLINTKGRFFAMSVRAKAESLLNHRSSSDI